MFRLFLKSLILFVSLYTPACILFCPGKALAAQVKKISKKKKIIGIDAGKNQGFKKGKKVCFYKKKKKVACGKITKAKSNKAVIKVKKRIGKIRKGFEARLAGDKGESAAASLLKGASRPSGDYSMAARLALLPYPTGATQASYNLIAYNGASAQAGESLWIPGDPYSSDSNARIFSSFGGEFEMTGLGLRVGGRIKNYTTYPTDSDYNANQTNLFLRSILSASATGLFVDYFWMFSGFSAGLGIDFDMTTLTMTATQEDDNGLVDVVELYNVSGSASILSLRIPLRYDSYIDPIGFTLGLNLMIPLAATGLSVTAVVNDTLHGNKNPDPETDVITALNFNKGGLAIELIMGAFFGF